jgi:hypothetical protein
MSGSFRAVTETKKHWEGRVFEEGCCCRLNQAGTAIDFRPIDSGWQGAAHSSYPGQCRHIQASAGAVGALASDGPQPGRLMSTLTDEIARRRTFAIISHPDAGKTTLTEKLLLFGGAIQLAGEVKARSERRRARSDWMAVECRRGISVSSAVMSFEHEGLAFNLLDTPGHQDFSPLGFQRGHLPVPAGR